MRAAAVLIAACFVSSAYAGSPDVRVADDGTVVARMHVDASSADVRAIIPELQSAGVNSNVLDVAKVTEGSCTAIRRTTRGLFRPMEIRTRFCPTANGWREVLVQSADFTTYEADWTLRPMEGGGTQVQLSLKSKINLMVPESMLQSGTVAGVKETFEALARKLIGRKP